MTASEVVRILGKAGWRMVRQRGSHQRLENPAHPGRPVTIAAHAGRDLPEGTLRAILRRTGQTRQEFEDLRRG